MMCENAVWVQLNLGMAHRWVFAKTILDIRD